MSSPPEVCYLSLCFVPLQSSQSSIFGFAEYLSALALMVLAWTIADVRYQFRVRAAPIPIVNITYGVISIVGVLILCTEIWAAEHWYVPKGTLISPNLWRAILGVFFLATFLGWAWFALIKPAKFSSWNSSRFKKEVYRTILAGSPDDLAVVADELSYSAEALINYTITSETVTELNKLNEITRSALLRKMGRVSSDAYDILHMFGDRRFCSSVVRASPVTALVLFESMERLKKYELPLGPFARNITSIAVSNKESFAYQEVAGYYTGYLGHHQPFTQTLYGNIFILNGLDQALDCDYSESSRWQSDEWDAYIRLVFAAFQGHLSEGAQVMHQSILLRAIENVKHAIASIYLLNGSTSINDDLFTRINIVVNFSKKMIESLNEFGTTPRQVGRVRKRANFPDVFDIPKILVFELICRASVVTHSADNSWVLRHNLVWSNLFDFIEVKGGGRTVFRRLMKALWKEVTRLETFPNYKGARILGMLLDVLGLAENPRTSDFPYRNLLHRLTLKWTRKNFARLEKRSPTVMVSGFSESMRYLPEDSCIVRRGAKILDRPQSETRLHIDSFE